MPRSTVIRFLTPTANKKGDLFTRLMTDLFRALGYDGFRLDVHKSGREIDIEGQHRHAQRLLRVECKAHEDRMGGKELNTFMGAVTRERKKALREKGMQIDAYFVSLGGFTAPGEDQEDEFDDESLILLDGPKIISELEQHKLLVDDTIAAEHAGQCAGRAGLGPGLLESIELLAHEIGYVKAVYYAQHRQRTHVALIDAYGTPLASTAAQAVIEADRVLGGSLHELTYLPPAPAVADLKAAQDAALDHYRRWLSAECSYMQLDGLPADNDVSSTKLKLERLFIPLKAEILNYEGPDEVNPNPVLTFDDFEFDPNAEGAIESISDFIAYSRTPEPISELLAPQKKLAFLAPPGGGKSTLLKRLATEYGFADQKIKFTDEMPAHDWLPLLIRCRDLQERAKKPFMKLLERLPKQVNMLPEPAAAFKTYIHEALQLGRVLLLVDGLDEIAKEQNRKIFAKNLLSFLAMFPQVTLVLTSREAGFRIVADVIASQCVQYKLAPFTEEDVQHLCVQWHVAVINDNPEVRQKALKLAQDIWKNKHIRRLAKNPLLLTTLFVVNRRQGGQLPKNRLMLYSKAVEVLLQTWNAEAFEPLDEEETLMRLCYLACYMMEKDMQQIGYRELVQTLKQAQDVVPELQWKQTSIADFIKQVEYRSSLLMQVGSDLIDGEEQHLFEFRHLTFQEYLAAKGYVEGFHPQNKSGLSLAELLIPHCGQSSWQEVIPLAAVLAKREAEDTMRLLVERCSGIKLAELNQSYQEKPPLDILRRCILDEVRIASPELLNRALKQLARLLPVIISTDFVQEIMASKYGQLYQQLVEETYMSDSAEWQDYGVAFQELSHFIIRQQVGEANTLYIEKVTELLQADATVLQLRGLFALADVGFSQGIPWQRVKGHQSWETVDANTPAFRMSEAQAVVLYQLLDQLLVDRDERLVRDSGVALGFMPNITPPDSRPRISTIAALFKLLSSIETKPFENESRRGLYSIASQTLKNMRLLGRDALLGEDVGPYYASELAIRKATESRPITQLGILAAWYRLTPLEDSRLIRQIDTFFNTGRQPQRNRDFRHETPRVVELLSAFGQEGEQLLATRAERRRAIDEGFKDYFKKVDDAAH